MTTNLPVIAGIRATAVSVPMKRPLVTSAQTIRSAPLLLIDLATREGVTGHAYVFCYQPRMAAAVRLALEEIASVASGVALAPRDLRAQLRRHFRLVGASGLVNTALAGFDMACWDALAKSQEQPLVQLLGSAPRAVRAYNSCGLGMSAPEALADEALELLAGGFRGVKIRLGRPDPKDDIEAVRVVRRALPADIALMADFNQALGTAEAVQRCRALDAEGLHWIEEPVRHDDYAGCAEVALATHTPIQIGENMAGAASMDTALKAGALDLCMPDVERIGGVTGWLEAAALAAVNGVPLSSHLMPEISAHLLAASPTCHWLEYVDWADAILREPLQIVDGCAQIPARPGSGIEWDDDAVRRLRIDT